MSSWGPDSVNCEVQCWAGGEFYYYGPYAEIIGYSTIPSAPSTNPDKFMGWTSLTNCTWANCPVSGSTYVLVQSGWAYGSYWNSSTPDIFAELYGNFDLSGVSCATHFCGQAFKESAGDSLEMQEAANEGNSYWFAFVEDNSQAGFPYAYVQDSFSAVGVSTSLPYILTSMEAEGVYSSSYVTLPISFAPIYAWDSSNNQLDTSPSHLLDYYGTAATGYLSLSFSASYDCSGCDSASVTIS